MYYKKRITQNFSNDLLAYYVLNKKHIEISSSEIMGVQKYLNDSMVKIWILLNSS
jgi:hypothetical protein